MSRALVTPRRLSQALAIALAAGLSSTCGAATDSHPAAFSFTHAGSASTGLVSLLATYTTPTTTAAPAIALPLFDRTLGHLNKVTVSVSTTTSTFAVGPTGLLSLVAAGVATRQLGYTVSAGTSTGADGNQVVSTGAALLTLLASGTVEIGGAPLASSVVFTAEADLQRFTGPGSANLALSATDTLSVSTLVSVANGAGMSGSGTYAGTAAVTYDYTPYRLAGRVFNDANQDGLRGATEAGTGLALYAKLLSATGTVLQATAVDPATGLYGFDVAAGSYRVMIDDNATAADTTPLVPPAGWSATSPVTPLRVAVVTNDLPGQDFGLVQATAVSGRLYVDDGAGGGTPNDGVRNGGEAGLPGRAMQLLDAGGNVLATAATAADGRYRLYIPATVSNGSALRIAPAVDASLRVTGAVAGSSGGTFDPAQRGLGFAFSNLVALAGIDIGAVVVAVPTAAGLQAGMPGTVLFFRHRYTAPTAGQLSLSTGHAGPADLTWSEDVYLDANGNGTIDGGETPVSGALGVVTGQVVWVIVKVTLPAYAAANVRLHTLLRADLALANAVPAATVSSSVMDDAVVLSADGGALQLFKTVSVDTASPGSTVTYTIRFVNLGTGPISHLQVNDETPPFTTFVSATGATLPASLSTTTTTLPTAGTSGALQWTFTGALAPNAEGSVQFVVQVAG